MRSCRRRGMAAPVLAVGDGTLGFWKAVREVFPDTREQRCWWPRQANVLAALPKSAHSGALAAMREIYNAEDIDRAQPAIRAFEIDDDAKYPKRSPRSSTTPMSSRRSTSTRPSLGSPQNHQPHRVNLCHRPLARACPNSPLVMVTISSPWRHTAWQCRRVTPVAGSCCAGCAAGWRCPAARTIRPGGWRSSSGCHPHRPC